MKKKIPCKVVRSVTLGQSDGAFRCAIRPSAERMETASVASLTYTSHLVVKRTDIDETHAARTLDLCA
ncbi:MAG: hypothetical protein ACYSWQ_28420 [Planctomycetota bacterium]